MPRNYDEVEISDNFDYPDREDVLLNKTHHYSKEEKTFEVMEKFFQRFMDLMIQNQKIVDGLVRSNDALREDIAVMIGKMERLYDKFDEFVSLVKEAAREDAETVIAKDIVEHSVKPLQEALEKMSNSIKESNETIADLLISIDKRLKRISSGGNQTPEVSTAGLKDKMMEILNKQSQ